MTMTGQNMIDLTREIMNAVGSNQWSDTTLRTWCGVAQYQELGNLINANDGNYMTAVSVTQDSNGQFNLTDLNSGSADTAKYWYKIQAVAQPATSVGQVQYFYKQVNFKEFPNPQPNTSLPYVWYQFGSKIQILPVSAGQTMNVSINYRPPRVDQLTTLAIVVDFPVGYEELVPWRAAWLALTKGGSEVQAAQDIKAIADELEADMLQNLGRIGWRPIVAGAFDMAEDYGG